MITWRNANYYPVYYTRAYMTRIHSPRLELCDYALFSFLVDIFIFKVIIVYQVELSARLFSMSPTRGLFTLFAKLNIVHFQWFPEDDIFLPLISVYF